MFDASRTLVFAISHRRVRCRRPRGTLMLEHLRIIELGQVIAGTFGGMILPIWGPT